MNHGYGFVETWGTPLKSHGCHSFCFYESMQPFLGQPGVVRLLRTYHVSLPPQAACAGGTRTLSTVPLCQVQQHDWPPASLDVALEPE